MQQADTGPSARRRGAAMSFDSARNRVVLFGGVGADPGRSLGILAIPGNRTAPRGRRGGPFGPGPLPRRDTGFQRRAMRALWRHSIACGGTRRRRCLRAVGNGTGNIGRHGTGPGPRAFHGAAFDSARSRVVLFGGASANLSPPPAVDSIFGDTWEQFQTGPVIGGPPGIVTFQGVPAGTARFSGTPQPRSWWPPLQKVLRISQRRYGDPPTCLLPRRVLFRTRPWTSHPGQSADFVLQPPLLTAAPVPCTITSTDRRRSSGSRVIPSTRRIIM